MKAVGQARRCAVRRVEFAWQPAAGSSSKGGRCGEEVGDEGDSDGLLPLLLPPPPPPPPSLGPDGALLRVGLAGAEEDDEAALPSVELAELKALEDDDGVEILAGLQSETNTLLVRGAYG